MTDTFHKGQRWISETEPELGLGLIQSLTERRVTVVFRASDVQREYARNNTPLRRVRFRIGDTIRNREDTPFIVQAVSEKEGLIFYHAGRRKLCETDLSDAISFNKPEERLFAGQLDPLEFFDLRVAALRQQHRRRKSAVRGFAGGRIDLIPHQLYIASEVAERMAPRVLLADEVGLGKTIEACLILHRLILTGRAQRALILVPESLVHQWFVELVRRFNLWFHIFDEPRCEAIETARPGDNPFLEGQFVLCSIRLFTGNPTRLQQAMDAGWDILVVDEAHHLGWSPASVSPEYALVESLGRKTPGLLLLTGTPEQLGITGHFARLRLLDPDRFYDLTEFIRETEHYQSIARRAEDLLSSPMELAALLDQHGTGRVSFRNTRAAIAGFPRRVAQLHPLVVAPSRSPRNAHMLDGLAEECAADTDSMVAAADKDESTHNFAPNYAHDPRIPWILDLLRTLDPEKVLLICHSQAKVAAIELALRKRVQVKVAVFHEGLTVVQRDRNAAWFAEEDGARLLLCSEIGSEGRNFQFAHHLVLFDLPLDPELLEQRIGRLDRIGQSSDIYVHVPYVVGSSQEVLARWYQEGLNSFEKNLHGGRELLERFGLRVYELTQNFHETKTLDSLIAETRTARDEIAARLQQGRDRLLELNSFRPEAAAGLVEEIQRQDRDTSLDAFMVSVLDHYSIPVQELADRTYRLGSAGVLADSFPGLPSGGLTVTCDRRRALAREDIQFLTWDHPLVSGALDFLLGSERGNCAFACWPDTRQSGLYLEAIYLIECVAPPHLHVDRFLPPTPVRVLVDHQGNDAEIVLGPLKNGTPGALLEQPEFREELLPMMIEKAEEMANAQISSIVAAARKEVAAHLEPEIARLNALQKVNRSVRTEEIELLVEQRRALDEHLTRARLRLDAIRLIQRGLT